MNCNPEPLVLKKRQKVRSAWISFAGRIAAQLIGAVATVALGVVVLGHRQADSATTASMAPTAASVLVAKPIRTEQGTVIVLVPLDRYNDVTADTVETVSRVLATDLSHLAEIAEEVQPARPMLAAANDH
jgi:hypothetical protein